MSYHDRLESELSSALDRFGASRPMVRLDAGDLTVAHYASHLRQNFFQLRERPVILSRAATRLTTSGEVSKLLLRRAVEEVYHDQLALNDLKDLGMDVAGLPDERPLPETSALLAFGHYQIDRLAPVGIIGTMYFLDFAPLHGSAAVADALGKIGVPAEAMSALLDHETVGAAHARAMTTYVDELVTGDQELEAVLYGLHTTAALYAQQIEAAFDAVDARA